jgi:hypothetical protein
MRSLKHLNLDGNRISELRDETFQNLHSLQRLSLAYNNLRGLNLEAFDYVGSLSFLRLDVSHNRIQSLSSNKTARFTSNSNIRHVFIFFIYPHMSLKKESKTFQSIVLTLARSLKRSFYIMPNEE